MEIHIGDRVADVTLVNKEGNKVQLTIDGVLYDVDIVMAENGSCSILHEGKSYNAELIRKEGGKSYTVNAHYQSYNIDVIDFRQNICACVREQMKSKWIRLSLRCRARLLKFRFRQATVCRQAILLL